MSSLEYWCVVLSKEKTWDPWLNDEERGNDMKFFGGKTCEHGRGLPRETAATAFAAAVLSSLSTILISILTLHFNCISCTFSPESLRILRVA